MARRAALIAVLCLCGAASASQAGSDDASFVETVYFRKNSVDGDAMEPQVEISFGSGSGAPVNPRDSPIAQRGDFHGSSADLSVPGLSQRLVLEREDPLLEETSQPSDEASFVEASVFKRRPLSNEAISPQTSLAFDTSLEVPSDQQNAADGQEGSEPGRLQVPGVADGLSLEGEAPLTPEAPPTPESETPTMKFFRLVREIFLAMRPRLE
ncbi:hypothetical protein Emag_005733 [Eimeria magna]